MNVKPTPTGGRIAQGDTPWLKYRVVDGVVEVWEVKTPSTGLGDTIAKVTDKLGIPKCGGCKRRQKKLNKLVPYGKD